MRQGDCSPLYPTTRPNSKGERKMNTKTKLTVRLNKTQVERAEEILESLGVSLSEAVSMFLAQVLLRNGLPFEVAVWDQDGRESLDWVYDFLHSDLNDEELDEGQLSLDDDRDDVAEIDENDSDCAAGEVEAGVL